VTWLLNKVTLGTLNKHTLLDTIAKGTSTGVLVGHNWNDDSTKKVVFNQVAGFVGIEVVFGGDPSAPSAQAEKSSRKLYVR
jgi:hypothetical protein